MHVKEGEGPTWPLPLVLWGRETIEGHIKGLPVAGNGGFALDKGVVRSAARDGRGTVAGWCVTAEKNDACTRCFSAVI